jgi:hypothetical protein
VFPSFTRAADSYNDELRLLDLELEMLSLKSQMLSLQRQRTQEPVEIQRDLIQPYIGRHRSSVLELDRIYAPDQAPLFPSMRPPWLQPADR